MAKFKREPEAFMARNLLKYWGNLVRNYDDACRDSDFFDVLANGIDHEKTLELIEAAYLPDELHEMEHAKSRAARLDLDDTLEDIFYQLWNFEDKRGKCRAVLEAALEYMKSELRKPGRNEVMERRFKELGRILRLNEIELEILKLAFVFDGSCLSWPCRVRDREKPVFIAMSLDRAVSEVEEALSPRGTLRRLDILDADFDVNYRTLGGFLDGTSDEAISRRFYAKASSEREILPWEYFGDLATGDGEVLRQMISASDGKCNVLLYGVPGTGKTSFAFSLARELGRTVFEIKQGDNNGKNMVAEARLVGIRMCNEQENPGESIVIVDESDELLRSGSGGDGFSFFRAPAQSIEKGVLNTILDEIRIPTIWISNTNPESMDSSVRRRFDYSVRFRQLNNAQRVAIWRNQVARHGLEGLIGDARIERYAEKYRTSAGGISTVLANVRRMSPGEDKVDALVETLMKPHCQLMGIRGDEQFMPAKGYSLEGLNIRGKVSPERLVKAVRNYLDAEFESGDEDKPRMNILLFGPPGTGKTEFVKHLGKATNRKVIVKKGSDILSKWVGESEQNISAAFRQAETEHAILFLDEIDGLLQNRAKSDARWEVTEVNELLQQMENFGGVMVAATNFASNLDPATMRRFTFKLEFGYLDDAGKRAFFERMFKTTLTEEEFAELRKIGSLAPGDFRTVRQSRFYLGEKDSNLDLIEALREECSFKKGRAATKVQIGFGAAKEPPAQEVGRLPEIAEL